MAGVASPRALAALAGIGWTLAVGARTSLNVTGVIFASFVLSTGIGYLGRMGQEAVCVRAALLPPQTGDLYAVWKIVLRSSCTIAVLAALVLPAFAGRIAILDVPTILLFSAAALIMNPAILAGRSLVAVGNIKSGTALESLIVPAVAFTWAAIPMIPLAEPWTFAVGHLMGSILACLVSLAIESPIRSAHRLRVQGASHRNLILEGLPLLGVNLLAFIAQFLPLALLGWRSTQISVGIYALADRIARSAAIARAIVEPIFTPGLAAAVAGRDSQRIRSTVSQALAISTRFTIAVAVLIGILAVISSFTIPSADRWSYLFTLAGLSGGYLVSLAISPINLYFSVGRQGGVLFVVAVTTVAGSGLVAAMFVASFGASAVAWLNGLALLTASSALLGVYYRRSERALSQHAL